VSDAAPSDDGPGSEIEDDDEAEIGRLMDAGAASLRFNAPLGTERADALVDFALRAGPTSAVDFGCGRGTLAHLLAAARPTLNVTGVDTDRDAIAAASDIAERLGLGGRCHFMVDDAASFSSQADVALCVGASHAFGDSGAMLTALGANGHRHAVIGDGVWHTEPSPTLLSMLGEMPTTPELCDLARGAGWLVSDVSLSSLDEWDEFESGWGAGVRSVGTPEAEAFADTRWAEYSTYRGVLGFAWLQLTARP